MRQITIVICAAVVVVAYGCTSHPRLRPAPAANELSGPGAGAAISRQHIVLEARVDAWRWTPADLDDHLAPVLIELKNTSDQPLRVRYEDFRLITPRGMDYAALPPFDIRGQVTEHTGRYAYDAPGFYLAPHLQPYYPGFGVYGSPFFYKSYYRSYYPMYRRYELPTRDMLLRALPEGVIEPGGRITGFVYFTGLSTIEPVPDQVQLRFVLVNAETRRRFGVVEIPFKVVD